MSYSPFPGNLGSALAAAYLGRVHTAFSLCTLLDDRVFLWVRTSASFGRVTRERVLARTCPVTAQVVSGGACKSSAIEISQHLSDRTEGNRSGRGKPRPYRIGKSESPDPGRHRRRRAATKQRRERPASESRPYKSKGEDAALKGRRTRWGRARNSGCSPESAISCPYKKPQEQAERLSVRRRSA